MYAKVEYEMAGMTGVLELDEVSGFIEAEREARRILREQGLRRCVVITDIVTKKGRKVK